jgi:hypothetical protein
MKTVVAPNFGITAPVTETGDPAHDPAGPVYDGRCQSRHAVLAQSSLEHFLEVGGR